ncbi:MAG: S8 family serine peptidase, partial [Planctomycetota bacterium]
MKRISMTYSFCEKKYLLGFALILPFTLLFQGCHRGGSSGGDAVSSNHSMSGTIYSMSNTEVDGDVNDPKAVYTPNDSFAQAQALPNPVTLSGYVNVASFGSEGRSFETGDTNDFYRVTLSTDQEVSLNIAERVGNNMELKLYDQNQVLVDASLGTARVHSVVAPASGDYFIEVYASRGASIYTMSLGHQSSTSSSRSSLHLRSRFVPHEVIVSFSEEIATQSARGTAREKAYSLGMEFMKGDAGRPVLLGFDEASRESVFQKLDILWETSAHETRGEPGTEETRQKLDTLRVIEALRRRSDVRYAEPNYLRGASATPNDQYYPLQWHYPLINLPQAWDVTTGSSSVIVAVIDTGVLLNHPDLAGQILGDGYDFIQDPASALDGDGPDSNPDDPGDQSAGGSSFHGTHVAGTIAAATDQANHRGVAGIAWQSRILPVRVLGLNSTG